MDFFFEDFLAMIAEFLKYVFSLLGRDTAFFDKIFPPKENI